MFEPFAICAKQSGKTFPNPLILSPKDALGNANERLQALGEADVEVQLATGVSKGKVYEEKDGERVGESRGAGGGPDAGEKKGEAGRQRLFNLHVA